jgi:hypothetical protein
MALERGLAYNPITGNLVLVSRSTAGNGIRVLSGSTGADVGFLAQGSGVISGGTFTTNMVDIDSTGAIYVANLSTSASANLKVYQWSSESASAPTTLINAATGLARAGDSFAVTGSGSNLRVASAGSNTTSASNFVVYSTTDGVTFSTNTYTSVPGTATTGNDYRLGLTFVDADTLIGTQATTGRLTDFTVGGSASLVGNIPLQTNGRILDYAMVGGLPVLASMTVNGANSPEVNLYDITTPTAPILLASLTTTIGSLVSNGNGTGALAWGNIGSNSATLYAMSTNHGIQAFDITFPVPEPSILGLSAVAMLGLLRRRR